MTFDFFINWPSPKITKILLIFSIILLLVVYPILMYLFAISNYPVSFFESQLSFSGGIIKSHYATMTFIEINLYIVANILDYGFMLSYGLLIFSLALILSRKFEPNTLWRKIGFTIAVFGILAAFCDGIENIFILLMANDPIGFPDMWAVSHSFFALIKYILMLIAISWLIIAGVVRIIRKKK
ncbi:MAG: hypothetical protein ACFE8E_03205 [Candidatus Hodarchaeota archaeon]